MSLAAVAAAAAGGAALVSGAVSSALRTTVLPRSAEAGLPRLVAKATRTVFALRAGRSASYERRDKVMAMLGPLTVLVQLAVWLALTVVGFTLLFWATGVGGWTRALELSGSSVFTLGTAVPAGLGRNLLTYLEAGLGLLLVTLLITYLPSMYAAFSRRENGVNLLRVRAGDPPRAVTLLVRYHQIDAGEARLAELWQSWEAWFADVDETHTTFAALAVFRSPQPYQSWVTAAGVLLDAASLWVSAVDHDPDPQAQLCIRAGFLTLRRVASSLGLPAQDSPSPTGPISVGRAEWDSAVAELAAAGLPLVADLDAAWLAWRGWRVNYDEVLLRLARAVEAPVAPWVSDRSPVGVTGRRRRRLRPPSTRA